MTLTREERRHTRPSRRKSRDEQGMPYAPRVWTRRRRVQKRKGGLGRGLGSLIPQAPPEEAATQPQTREEQQGAPAPSQEQAASNQGVLMVPVGRIEPNPRQPRQAILPEQLDELANSIREHGVLQPILVTRGERGKYTLVAGERRWRAAEQAGLDEVPVLVKEAS